MRLQMKLILVDQILFISFSGAQMMRNYRMLSILNEINIMLLLLTLCYNCCNE